jgi:hypothetical protein
MLPAVCFALQLKNNICFKYSEHFDILRMTLWHLAADAAGDKAATGMNT